MSEFTALIAGANQGAPGCMDRLYQLLYADLHRLAHARLRGGDGPTLLDTTGLVHESYLRLVHSQQLHLADRQHFLAYAARAMRSVVVDMLRAARAERRGGLAWRVTLDSAVHGVLPSGEAEVLAVHEALDALAEVDERLVRVVELRYFVGLEMDEIAQALGIGKRTAERDWEKARSFLWAALRQG